MHNHGCAPPPEIFIQGAVQGAAQGSQGAAQGAGFQDYRNIPEDHEDEEEDESESEEDPAFKLDLMNPLVDDKIQCSVCLKLFTKLQFGVHMYTIHHVNIPKL
jgi:hypothetical protein